MVEEKANKYRVDNKLKRTLQSKEMIPFLRTNDWEYNKIIRRNRKNMQFKSFNQTTSHIKVNDPLEDNESPKKESKTPQRNNRMFAFLKRKEKSWNQYI